MIKKEQMMNRHQINYIYGELTNIWNKNLNDHIETTEQSDEYKSLVKEYASTENSQKYIKDRKETLENTISATKALKILLKLDDDYHIGEIRFGSRSKSYVDSEARKYMKDSVKFEKEFNELTDDISIESARNYALNKLKLTNKWQLENAAHIEIKSRLALIPIGDHDEIIKSILEEVTIEKMIEFVNA